MAILPTSSRASTASGYRYSPTPGSLSPDASSSNLASVPSIALSSTYPTSSSSRRPKRRGSHSSKYSTYFKRMFSIPQMDFELALWQMLYLVVSPRRVYRNVYYHRQTKNYWARDDPAFHILLALSMCVAAIAYGIVWRKSFIGIVNLIVHTVFVEFLFAGMLVASIGWAITNQFMLQHQIHAVEQNVEWMYCFDIHCNAFVPFFLITYVIQFLFLAIVVKDGVVPRIFANTIYYSAISYYWYITFLGYSGNSKQLPVLKRNYVKNDGPVSH